MKHDVLTRTYLRQYAFLMHCRPRTSPGAAFHFSTLAVSGIASLVVFTALAVALWISSLALGRTLAPWLLPNWAFAALALGIAFLPGMYVDRKMAGLRTVDSALLARYDSRHQRILWLLTIASIIPLTILAGICFVALRNAG